MVRKWWRRAFMVRSFVGWRSLFTHWRDYDTRRSVGYRGGRRVNQGFDAPFQNTPRHGSGCIEGDTCRLV